MTIFLRCVSRFALLLVGLCLCGCTLPGPAQSSNPPSAAQQSTASIGAIRVTPLAGRATASPRATKPRATAAAPRATASPKPRATAPRATATVPRKPSATVAAAPAAEPIPGFRAVTPASLPPEAQQTLALIAKGGPFPYRQDGVVFQNRERILPRKAAGYYHEYTVKTPGEGDRGARRIITGASGELFYTGDHYASFVQVLPQ